jgi:pyruvate ferredoxin oxidoreductase beta subunit
MPNIKQLAMKEDLMLGGHNLCAGCPEGMMMRALLHSTSKKVVVVNNTGCLEVSTTLFPHNSWKVPWIHSAFENSGAVATGVVEAYAQLKKQGKIAEDVEIVVVAGDGGTYDIGLQALSGAWERGHDFLWLVEDNEAYMNTGIQRSGSTPLHAWTKTSEVGKAHLGKEQVKKDIVAIAVAHRLPYIATLSPGVFTDFLAKTTKAFTIKGPRFLCAISPCVPGWKYESNQTLNIAKLAVDTCIWPLYEIEHGKWKLSYDPGENKKPITEYVKLQGRFKHLMLPENKPLLDEMQRNVDTRWEYIKKMCAADVPHWEAQNQVAGVKVTVVPKTN